MQDTIHNIEAASNTTYEYVTLLKYSGVARNIFWRGGVQQVQLSTEGRENGDLGAVAP
jgi:hypothetical protein